MIVKLYWFGVILEWNINNEMKEYCIITSQIKYKILYIKNIKWVLNYSSTNKRQNLLGKIIHSAAIGLRRPFSEARLNGNPYNYEIGDEKLNQGFGGLTIFFQLIGTAIVSAILFGEVNYFIKWLALFDVYWPLTSIESCPSLLSKAI